MNSSIEHNPVIEGHPWKRAVSWIAFLSLFFLLTYSFTNWFASRRADVPSIAFGWERRVPFLPWTIVPYWSIDVLYPISLLMASTRLELDRQARRLFAAQLISVFCFLLFPLRCVFERPETSSAFGWLFRVLFGFDRPFNEAPSLHVSLAVVLWIFFSARLQGFRRNAMRAWLVLVIISTMTTHQHQFIDLPTGILAGLLAVALVPDDAALRVRTQRLRRAAFYLSGSVLLAAIVIKFAGSAAQAR